MTRFASVDAGQDASRVRAHDVALGRDRAAEQVRVHPDGAVMPTHLMEHRRRRLADGGEMLAAIELALHGDELLVASLAQDAGVVQPLQDRVQRERGQAGGREAGGPPVLRRQHEERHHHQVQQERHHGHVRSERFRDPHPRARRRHAAGDRREISPGGDDPFRDDHGGRDRQVHAGAGGDRRHAHRVLGHVAGVADVAVRDAVEHERLAAPAAGGFLREPDRAHEARAVEEHGEREAQDRRHPEYGEDRRTQEVGGRGARPHHRHVDLDALRELDAERPLERQDAHHGQVPGPCGRLDPRQPRRGERDVQPAEPRGGDAGRRRSSRPRGPRGRQGRLRSCGRRPRACGGWTPHVT